MKRIRALFCLVMFLDAYHLWPVLRLCPAALWHGPGLATSLLAPPVCAIAGRSKKETVRYGGAPRVIRCRWRAMTTLRDGCRGDGVQAELAAIRKITTCAFD